MTEPGTISTETPTEVQNNNSEQSVQDSQPNVPESSEQSPQENSQESTDNILDDLFGEAINDPAKGQSEIPSQKNQVDANATETKNADETSEASGNWGDSLQIVGNDNKVEADLIKATAPDGTIIGFVKPEFKDGVLARADYTTKTQKLSEDRKAFEAERTNFNQTIETEKNKINETIEPFIHEYNALKYGKPFDKQQPLESDFVSPFAEGEEKKAQQLEYYKAYNNWKDEGNQHQQNASQIRYKQEATAQVNQNIVKSFDETLGKQYGVKSEDLIKDLARYTNPTITHGQVPMPEDALEIFYIGKNWNKILPQIISEEKKKWIKEMGSNLNGNKKQPIVQQQPTKNSNNTKDIFDEMEAEGWLSGKRR